MNEIENKWDQIKSSLLEYMEIALQLRSVLQFLPGLSFNILSVTFSSPTSFTAQPMTRDRAKLYALSQALDQWVDWETIKTKQLSVAESVLAVLHHYHADFSLTEIALFYDSKYQFRLDEAVLLYKLSHTENELTNILLSSSRNEFIEIFKKEEEEQQILDQMFFYKSNGIDAVIFDGFVFKNALGKNFADLLDCSELTSITAFSALNGTEKNQLMKKKFSLIGESTKYIIGTVQHSLASALLRIKQHQNKVVSDDWPDDLALLKEFKHLVDSWSENKNYPLHPFLLFTLHLNQSSGIYIKQATEKLLKNAGERLYSVYGPAPYFNLRQATTEILSEYGMTKSELEQIHGYIIVRQHLIILASPQVVTGDFYQEFWDRAQREHEWINRYMIIDSSLINVPDKLNEKWCQFVEKLPQHAWIQAKAKDNLIMAKKVLSFDNINQEAQKLITQCLGNQCRLNIVPITPITGGEVFDELINIIPFVGSAYNMEEGIRHGDWLQAVLGTVSLGIDSACLIYSGSKTGVIEEKSNLSSLTKNDQKVIKSLEQATEQTTDLPLSHWTDNIDTITIDADPYKLSLADGHVPLAFRKEAAQVRAGTKGKQWKGYPVVYVIDQDRVVPIKSSGGGFFYEVDWQTEEPHYTKMITREPGEKYYTKVGLKGGGWARDKAAINYDGMPENSEQAAYLDAWGKNSADEHAFISLLELLPDATDTEIKPNFDALFHGEFDLALEAGQSPAVTMHIYKTIYQRSPTFRRLFNYAVEQSEDIFRIKITGTVHPVVDPVKKQIKLPSKSALPLLPQYINLY